jgi:energy-coupling factor transporter ATP-binding protein EcfA2
VNKTLSSLGLSETKDLKVGSVLDKTISGGQRKRLNIGLELLREPSVLFVDEPTSGLASRDSENIMDLLKELSRKGKLIFAVIHQPSSDIFKLFDKLIILDEGGYQIYYGNPVEAIIYFKALFNLVDSEHGTCNTCGNVNPEQIFNIIETQVVNEFGKLTNERKVNPSQWYDIFLKKICIEHINQETNILKSALDIPGRIKQLKIFAARDLLSKIVNKQYLLINLLEAPLLAILLAYIVKYFPFTGASFKSVYSFSDNVNIPAYIFMSIVVALFMGLTVSAEEIVRDRKILQRESFLNLSRGSYLYSKLLILFTLSAIQTLSYTLIGNYILEIRGMNLPFWLILFSTSCFANVLGLNISSAFNSAVTIYILIPILLIPQILLSGVVVKFDELNPSISSKDKVPVIGEIMASRWAFEAAMVTQFKENKFEKSFFDLDKKIGNAEYKNLYYVPVLLTKLNYCNRNYRETDPLISNRVISNFELLSNEIGDELTEFGTDNLPVYSKLNKEDFNAEVYKKTNDFLKILKRVYVRRYNEVTEQKESLIQSLTNSQDKLAFYSKLRRDHHNKRIDEMVKKKNEVVRIIEYKNKLVQKIYPIFQEPSGANHLFDFRTIFYAPSKHFISRQIDTLWFNIAMIWFMTVILFVTLYFDLLRKIIDSISNTNIQKQSD